MEPVMKMIEGFQVSFYTNRITLAGDMRDITLMKVGKDITLKSRLSDVEIILNVNYTQPEKEAIASCAINTILQGGNDNGHDKREKAGVQAGA